MPNVQSRHLFGNLLLLPSSGQHLNIVLAVPIKQGMLAEHRLCAVDL